MADIRQSTVILDDFQRANEDPLSHGGDWSNPDTFWTALRLESNIAYKGTGVYSNSYWNPITLIGDEAQVWACTFGGGQPSIAWGFHLYTVGSVGGSNTSDGYFWRDEVIVAGGSTSYLYRLDNNTGTVIDSNAVTPGANGGWIGLIQRVNTGAGQVIEGWGSSDNGDNWTLYVSASDATYQGDMYGGISIAGELTGFSCFGAGPAPQNMPQIYRIIKGLATTTP